MDALKKDLLYLELRRKILSGEYPEGTRFPTENEFCRQLGVGKVTLRAALEKLANDHLIIRMPRRGTIVRPLLKMDNAVLLVHGSTLTPISPALYMLPGIESIAAQHGITTERCFIDFLWHDTKQKALPALKAKNYRGVMLLSSNMRNGEPDVEMLRQLNIPVVIPNGDECDKELGFALQYVDFPEAVRLGLSHLALLGHRRVRLLSYEDHLFRKCSEKQIRQIFSDFSMDCSGKLIFSYAQQSIEAAVDEMLSGSSKPSAIFCYSDFSAGKLLEILPQKKIRVPQDISVLGLSGYAGSVFLTPSLSTVDLEYDRNGRAAMELLMNGSSWYAPGKPGPVIKSSFHIENRESTVEYRKDGKTERR